MTKKLTEIVLPFYPLRAPTTILHNPPWQQDFGLSKSFSITLLYPSVYVLYKEFRKWKEIAFSSWNSAVHVLYFLNPNYVVLRYSTTIVAQWNTITWQREIQSAHSFDSSPILLPPILALGRSPVGVPLLATHRNMWILRLAGFERRRIRQETVELVGPLLPARDVRFRHARKDNACCWHCVLGTLVVVDVLDALQFAVALYLVEVSGTEELFHLAFAR